MRAFDIRVCLEKCALIPSYLDATSSGLEELLDCRVDGHRQALHVVDRDVPLSAFDGADIGAMQPGFLGQVFLRNSQSLAIAPQVFAKDVANVALATHEFRLDRMMSL